MKTFRNNQNYQKATWLVHKEMKLRYKTFRAANIRTLRYVDFESAAENIKFLQSDGKAYTKSETLKQIYLYVMYVPFKWKFPGVISTQLFTDDPFLHTRKLKHCQHIVKHAIVLELYKIMKITICSIYSVSRPLEPALEGIFM